MLSADQLSDNEQSNRKQILDFLRSTAESLDNTSYRKALNSFISFLNSANLSPLSPRVFADWLIDLWLNDNTLKTASHYLDIIAALSVKAREAGFLPAEVIDKQKQLKKILKTKGPELWRKPLDRSRMSSLIDLFRRADRLTGNLSKATDLILLSILLGARNPLTLAKTLTKESLAQEEETMTEAEREVVDGIRKRNENARRKYLFDFDQSRKTPLQIDREVLKILGELARSRNLPADTDLRSLPETIWLLTALSTSVNIAEAVVRKLGKVPETLPILSLADTDSEAESSEIGRLVNEVLLDNPQCWFAMRLRPHTPLKEVEDRLEQIKSEVPVPAELFYPHEEIAKRVGKKLVFKQKPFINDVVFIRNRRTDIHPLFNRIGDLAWCYTVSGRPGSPYAAISNTEFKRFQTAIGRFTIEIDPQPLGTLIPQPGEPVILISGPLAGRHAMVETIVNKDTLDTDNTAGSILYRLKLTAENGIEWRVSVPKHQLAPIPNKIQNTCRP